MPLKWEGTGNVLLTDANDVTQCTMAISSGSSTETWGPFFNIAATGGFQVQSGSEIYLITNGGHNVQCWAPALQVYTLAGVLTRTLGSAAAATDQFTAVCTSVVINQADTTTTSATGAPFTVQAQNATGSTSVGGTLFLAPGTGTTRDGNIALGTTTFTPNGMGTGVFVATATATPTASPTGGVYAYASSAGNLRAVDSQSSLSVHADLHPTFKANQSPVAFTPVSVKTYKRANSTRISNTTPALVTSVESTIIPSGASQNCAIHCIVKVTVFDTTASATYHAIYQVGAKVVAGTLTMENSGTGTLCGVVVDGTSGAPAANPVTGAVNSGGIDLKFTLSKDNCEVVFDCDIEIVQFS